MRGLAVLALMILAGCTTVGQDVLPVGTGLPTGPATDVAPPAW